MQIFCRQPWLLEAPERNNHASVGTSFLAGQDIACSAGWDYDLFSPNGLYSASQLHESLAVVKKFPGKSQLNFSMSYNENTVIFSGSGKPNAMAISYIVCGGAPPDTLTNKSYGNNPCLALEFLFNNMSSHRSIICPCRYLHSNSFFKLHFEN